MEIKDINFEKVGIYFTAITILWMIMSGLVDVHKEQGKSNERIMALEVKLEALEN